MFNDAISALRHGLSSGQIVPYFQPQISLQTGELHGFEALARWEHPTRGIILPEDFVPIAEAGDLIGELTDCLVSAAARIATAWPASLKLAVNVSPLELRDWSLPDRLVAALEGGGLAIERLVVDIAETALIGNLELAHSIAEDLKKCGVRLALDDFGTGYSSLHYVQSLPFDDIKIDATLVSSMNRRRENRKIVAALVGLGHSLGLTTFAEGVEEQNQADVLVSLGCQNAQGWLFGRPVPARGAAEQITRFRAAPASEVPLHSLASATEPLAQLRAIYDGAPIGLCFLDCNLRCMSLNRRFADLHGISSVAGLGRSFREVLPELAEEIEPFLRRGLAGEEQGDVEVSVGGPGAADKVLLTCRPARDEAGEVVGISIAELRISRRAQV